MAYATVSEDAQLIDMPNGDAVANLKAGASLDILGKIGVDGENYSFVAVVGTEIKGYINDIWNECMGYRPSRNKCAL